MQRKGAFDHILLETTGLADPGRQSTIFFDVVNITFVSPRPYRVHVLA